MTEFFIRQSDHGFNTPAWKPMMNFVVALFLILCSVAMFGQKTRFSQTPPKAKPPVEVKPILSYPVKVHIFASRILNFCDNFGMDMPTCNNGLSADAMIDGKKFVLWGASTIDKHEFSVLVPGDYNARLTSDIHNLSNTVIHQEYDVVLSDSTIWHCRVVGLSE